MKFALTAFVFLFACQVTFAQFDSLGLYTKWSEGTLMLENDRLLKGYIRHNDKLGVVKFKQDLEDDEQFYIDTRVLAMEYFDEDQIRYRKFATFNINIEEMGRTATMLFEVMREFKDFAVLIRYDKVNLVLRERYTSFNKIGYEQFERICLVDRDGKAEALLVINNFRPAGPTVFVPKVTSHFNRPVMKRCMGTFWPLVNAYIKTNKLNMNAKADVLEAIDYYGILETEKYP
jgi:hypothetical protein